MTKRFISLLMTLVLIFGISAIPAQAAAADSPISSREKLLTRSSVSAYLPDGVERISLSTPGESYILCEDENGTWIVTLADKEENTEASSSRSARAGTNKTSRYTLNITYKDWLGNEKTGVVVEEVCHWVSNGDNNYIINLEATYTIKHSAFSCAWNDNYTSAYNDYHSMGLDVMHKGNTITYVLDAFLIRNSTPTVDVGYYCQY